jgi:beta-N-acetylhexosaminidase
VRPRDRLSRHDADVPRPQLIVTAGFVGLALVAGGCNAAPPSPADRAEKAASSPGLTIDQQIGQRIVIGYPEASPPPAVLAAARAGRIGGVILYQANVPSVASARRSIALLQQAAREGGQPDLLVLIDQEGGLVKRFPGLPPGLSAQAMGARPRPDATARRQGYATGRALRRIGVNVDLAPVVDVPDRRKTFLRSRAFAHRPAAVARAACAFATGLRRANVAATLKHFPGLGRARGDTDLEHVTITASRARLRADLAPYAECGAAGQLAMVSSATYPRLGIHRPAALSPRTYALLAEVGFRGLAITDAVDTPSYAGIERPDRLAVNAGADLLVFAHSPARADRAFHDLVADQRAGRLHPPGPTPSATRILALKTQLAQQP